MLLRATCPRVSSAFGVAQFQMGLLIDKDARLEHLVLVECARDRVNSLFGLQHMVRRVKSKVAEQIKHGTPHPVVPAYADASLR